MSESTSWDVESVLVPSAPMGDLISDLFQRVESRDDDLGRLIGRYRIIEELGRIAPISAVRGNNDREGPASLYPLESTEVLGGCRFLLTHQVKLPKRPDDPALKGYRDAGVDVVSAPGRCRPQRGCA